MLGRTSTINNLKVKIVSFASVVQLGDSCVVNSLNRALAVQREASIFFGNEGNFSSYPVYSEPIPLPPVTELSSFTHTTHQLNPIIKVNNLNIIGISAATILHVGNSKIVSMEARIKHIRQLLSRS
ncbi:MAG: spore germination protein GerPE [Bacillota bacterium]|nr:spore germination protein GerPE [Bacillota bacterium]